MTSLSSSNEPATTRPQFQVPLSASSQPETPQEDDSSVPPSAPLDHVDSDDSDRECGCFYDSFPPAKDPGVPYVFADLPFICIAEVISFLDCLEAIRFEPLCKRVQSTYNHPQAQWCTNLVLGKAWRKQPEQSRAIREKWFPRLRSVRYLDHCKCHHDIDDFKVAELQPLLAASRHHLYDLHLTFSCLKTGFGHVPANWRVVPKSSSTVLKRLERITIKTSYTNETMAGEALHCLQHLRIPACRRFIVDGCLLTSTHVLDPVLVSRALQSLLRSCERLTHLVLKDFDIEETPINSAPASRRSLGRSDTSRFPQPYKSNAAEDYSDWFLTYQAWQYRIALDFVLGILASVPITIEHVAISHAFQVDALLSALWQLRRTKQPLPTPTNRQLTWSMLGSLDLHKALTAVTWIESNASQLFLTVDNVRVFSGETYWPPFPLTNEACVSYLSSLRTISLHIATQIEIPFSNLTSLPPVSAVDWRKLDSSPIVFPSLTCVMLSHFNPMWPAHTLLLPMLRFTKRDAVEKHRSRIELKVHLTAEAFREGMVPTGGVRRRETEGEVKEEVEGSGRLAEAFDAMQDVDSRNTKGDNSSSMERRIETVLATLARTLHRHEDLRTCIVSELEISPHSLESGVPRPLPNVVLQQFNKGMIEKVFAQHCPSVKVDTPAEFNLPYRLSIMSVS